MRKILVISALWGLSAIPALSSEAVFGVGAADPSNDRNDRELSISADLRTEPLGYVGTAGLRLGAGTVIDGLDELWVGAGVTAEVPLQGGWFIEGSAMPGYYDFDEGVNTMDDLALRTRLGVGHHFSTGSKMSVALDHRAGPDGGFRNHAERLSLQYHVPLGTR